MKQNKQMGVYEYLQAHNVKPSVQRMAVMEYLLKHKTHPTADEIFLALHEKLPTLSKTTVYNTLKLLTENEACLQLTIDERNTCFDGDTSPHAHFLCNDCNKVFDFWLKADQLNEQADIPEGFIVESAHLYYRGICPKCAAKALKKAAKQLA